MVWRNEGRTGETRAAVHARRTGVWRARRATETTAYYSEMERPVSRKRSGQAIQKGFYKHASSHQMRLRSFISCLYVGFGRWPLSGRNEASGRRADEEVEEREAEKRVAFGGLAVDACSSVAALRLSRLRALRRR